MAKTLQEILSGTHLSAIIARIASAPVHHLVNVPSQLGKVQCACGGLRWYTKDGKPFDDSKLRPHTVTCKRCLAVMGKIGDRFVKHVIVEDDVQPDVTVRVT